MVPGPDPTAYWEWVSTQPGTRLIGHRFPATIGRNTLREQGQVLCAKINRAW